MILLIGSEAYSPFRMDAIKDSIAKAAPGLGPVEIDARWVYAIETEAAGCTQDVLERAGVLLNAEGGFEMFSDLDSVLNMCIPPSLLSLSGCVPS